MNRLSNMMIAAAILLAPAVCRANESAPTGDEPEEKVQGDGDVVNLTPKNLEHIKIVVEPVRLGNLKKILRVPGRVSANLNKTAVVTSTFEGRLQKLNYDLNDRVSAGDVLGLVDSPELFGKPSQLRAPIGGVVIDRKRSTGEHVSKESEIYTITDPSTLWVIAEIREKDIALMSIGQDATFRVLAYPEKDFPGRVTRLAGEVEAKSRTVEARIETDNSSGRLKPGMFADVEIVTTVEENVPIIDDAALQTEGDDQIVFVARSEGSFEKRTVKLGHEQDGRVRVLEGVAPGEKVVTDGSFVLKSEMLKGELGEE